MQTREEIVSQAIGDGGNTTRAHAAIDALHVAGWTIQMPPADAVSLIVSLRERGQNGDADDVAALALELDLMRRGWGPSTPTERMLRRADIITIRSFIEQAYGVLIELNMNNYTVDDVEDANNGTIEAIKVLCSGMACVHATLQALAGIPDHSYAHDQIQKITRDIAGGGEV